MHCNIKLSPTDLLAWNIIGVNWCPAATIVLGEIHKMARNGRNAVRSVVTWALSPSNTDNVESCPAYVQFQKKVSGSNLQLIFLRKN